MADFTIYSSDGLTTKYQGACHYVGTYLKPGYLEFDSIGSPTPIQWAKGDYVDYTRTGLKYRLYGTPKAVKQGEQNRYGGSFLYENVQLFDDTKMLEFCPFTDLVPEDNTIHYSTQPSVAFVGKPSNVAERIQECLDDMYPGEWSIQVISGLDPVSDADLIETLDTEMDFSVSGVNCQEALEKIYELWGLGWSFTVVSGINTITIGAPNKMVQANTTPVYSRINGQGLTRLSRSVSNAEELGTRLYVFGSMKNMPGNYYQNKGIYNVESVNIEHLMIPLSYWGQTSGDPDARKAYIDAPSASIARLGIIPRYVYFDGSDGKYPEIYPTLEGMTIGAVIDGKQALSESDYVPSLSKYSRSDRVDEIKTGSDVSDAGSSGTGASAFFSSDVGNLTGGTFTEQAGVSFEVEIGSFSLVGSGEITAMFNGGTNTAQCNLPQSLIGRYGAALTCMLILEAGSNRQGAAIRVVYNGDGSCSLIFPESIFLPGDNAAASIKVYISGFIRSDKSTTSYAFSIGSDTQVTVGASYSRESYFTLEIPQVGFNINLQADLGSGKKISMKSGKCAARDFVIKTCTYNQTNDSWDLTLYRSKDEDLGIMFPNDDYQIEQGDRYVLLEIALPELYIAAASKRLYEQGQKLLSDICTEKPFYEPEIDAIFMNSSGRSLREGMWMHLSGDEIVDGGEDYSLIDTLRINEDTTAIPTYDVTLRKKKTLDWTEAVSTSKSEKSVSNVSVATGSGGLTKEQADLLYKPIDSPSDSLFEIVEYDETNHKYAAHLKLQGYFGGALVDLDGIYTDGFMSAGGLNANSGGGGGVSNLWALDDVKHGSTGVLRSDGVTPVQPGDVLVYGVIDDSTTPDTYGWYAKAENSGGGGTGTVTSVGLQAASGSGISVSGSPITSSGTFTIGIDSSHYLPLATDKAAWDAKVSNVQADWNATTGLAVILNKPTIPAAQVQTDWNATSGMGVLLNKPSSLPASDVYAWAKASTKPSYTFSELTSHPTTLSGYGITDAKFGTAGTDSIPITLGSTTQSVLTAHQSLSGYVPTTRKVNGHALSSDVTVTASDVGLGNVTNLAASAYFTDLSNITTGTDANKISATIGGTTKKLTVNYATNAGSASSAARLSGNTAYSVWGVEYWASGVPKSVTGQPTLYVARNQVATSAGDATLYGISGFTSAASASNTDKARVVWDSDNDAWHFYGGIYADSFVSAGGLNSGSGGGGGVENLWALNDVYHVNGAIVHADDSALANGDVLTYNSTKGKWVAGTPATGGITGITMNGSAVTVTNGVAALGTVLTSDANYVKLTGNQTIGGDKTFSDIFVADGASIHFTDSSDSLDEYLANIKTLNSDFYAPTSAGTSGQYLVSGGSGNAPTWASAGSVANNNTGLVTGGTVYTALSSYQTKVSALGSTDKPVYISAAGTFSVCSRYAGGTAVTRNGVPRDTMNTSFYAPDGGGTSGQVLVAAGTSNAPTWQSEVFIDKTNSRVGIGTTSPSYKLHVVGNSYFDGYLDIPSNKALQLGGGIATIGTDLNGLNINADNTDINIDPDSGGAVNIGGYIVNISGEASIVSALTIGGDIIPTSDGTQAIGSSSAAFGEIYANRWYPDPTNAPNNYIEWDSTNSAFKIVGDVYATGQIAAGGVASNS